MRYLQSREILLNLSMKCWNSALNAQGSRIIGSTGSSSQKSLCSSGGAQSKGTTRWSSSWSSQFATKIGGKTSLGPNYFCYVVYFHSQLRVLMPYYTKTGRFRPPWSRDFTDNSKYCFYWKKTAICALLECVGIGIKGLLNFRGIFSASDHLNAYMIQCLSHCSWCESSLKGW